MADRNVDDEQRKANKANYNRKYRETGRPKRFTLELTGDDEVRESVKSKLSKVKNIITGAMDNVSNTEAINTVLDFFLERHKERRGDVEDENDEEMREQAIPTTSGHIPVDREDVDQPIFLTTISSVKVLTKMVTEHSHLCKDCHIEADEKYKKGHASVLKLYCVKCDTDLQNWPSSPYLPNKKFLVNHRMAHGYMCSGIIPNQFNRLTEAADIGTLTEAFLRDHVAQDFNLAVAYEYSVSCKDALSTEMATAVINHEGPMEDFEGIKIITDARHGWRKNSRQTDVVCIGYETHKVLLDEIITKDDDLYAQRHERLGTERIYQHFEDHELGPVSIAAHAHDRNLSINKYIRENHDTKNQNDTWHAGKQVEKLLKGVAFGPQYKHGITWHTQLSDKVSSIRTHVHYCIRECEGSSEKLKQSLDNIVQHYQNVHTGCSEKSNCRTYPNHQPSKMIIKDPKAEVLLRNAIRKSAVYQYPADYIMAMDTFYVESFNNVLNLFHDKRIAFGNEEYIRRSCMAVLHWNENVDRPYSSIWNPPEAQLAPNIGPRHHKGKKVYKKRTFMYTLNIWNTHMDFLFEN